MTRSRFVALLEVLALAFMLWAPYSDAQVYVRPSKGASFIGLTMDTNALTCSGGYTVAPYTCTTNIIDVTGFDELRVEVVDSVSGSIADSWAVATTGSYAIFTVTFAPALYASMQVHMWSATVKTARFGISGFSGVFNTGTDHGVVAQTFVNTQQLRITPIAFASTHTVTGYYHEGEIFGLSNISKNDGPPPVLIGGVYKASVYDGGLSSAVTAYDIGVNGSMSTNTAGNLLFPGNSAALGGYGTSLNVHVTGQGVNGTSVATGPCVNNVDTLTILASNTSTAVPATPLAGRRSLFICNSAENAGTPIIKCRDDGALPIMGLSTGQSGIALNKSDCITYYTSGTWTDGGASVHCISDTADAGLVGNECN